MQSHRLQSQGSIITVSDQLVEALLSDQFSGVVDVVCRGTCLLQHAKGRTRGNAGEAIGCDTRFATASVTKMFTAACIARLADHGECQLDRPIAAYVAQAQAMGESVTLDRLLSHRSGLGDYIDDDASLPFSGFPVDRLTSAEAFLPYVLNVDRYAVGEFRYSSAGFILLGLAIESVTGQTYHQAIRSWVLEPAGLTATDFRRVDDPSPGFAWGFMDNGEPNIAHVPPIGGPDGGIVTTVGDLRSFFAWLDDGAWSDSTRAMMWERLSDNGPRDGYARGFDVVEIGGVKWLGHTGSDPGLSAFAAFEPGSQSGIAVLCNRGSIAFRVVRLLRQWFEEDGWPPGQRLQLTGDARLGKSE